MKSKKRSFICLLAAVLLCTSAGAGSIGAIYAGADSEIAIPDGEITTELPAPEGDENGEEAVNAVRAERAVTFDIPDSDIKLCATVPDTAFPADLDTISLEAKVADKEKAESLDETIGKQLADGEEMLDACYLELHWYAGEEELVPSDKIKLNMQGLDGVFTQAFTKPVAFGENTATGEYYEIAEEDTEYKLNEEGELESVCLDVDDDTVYGVYTVKSDEAVETAEELTEEEMEETEEETEEPVEEAPAVSLRSPMMLGAPLGGPLGAVPAGVEPSTNLARFTKGGTDYFLVASITTDKRTYEPGDTVHVIVTLDNMTEKEVKLEKKAKGYNYLAAAIAIDDTALNGILTANGLDSYDFSGTIGKDGDNKNPSTLTYSFDFQVPYDVTAGEKGLTLALNGLSDDKNGFKFKDLTNLMNNNQATIGTDFTVVIPPSVYIADADDYGSQAQTNGDMDLSVEFDLKSFVKANRQFDYEIKVEAADMFGHNRTDITEDLDGTFAWSGLPGIAAATASSIEGSGAMGAVGADGVPIVAPSILTTTLPAADFSDYNAFYVTLTVTDSVTGDVSTKTVAVARYNLDLDNYTWTLRDDTQKNGTFTRTGLDWLEKLYYGKVAEDDRVPFSSASELKACLRGQASYEDATAFLQKYIFDLYEPHVGVSGNYEDTGFVFPKDSYSPFHVKGTSEINNMGTYTLADAGITYDDYFKNLTKTASEVSLPDRKYKVNITAETDPQPTAPAVFVIMVPTMWQMYDEAHAKAQKGEGLTQVGSILTDVDEMAYIYDVKQALIRFAEYLQQEGSHDGIKGSNAGIALVNTQHGGDYSMIAPTVSGKTTTGGYFTTDMDDFIEYLHGWDSFGDCEHVHWSQTTLDNALSNISTEFAGWKDADGVTVDTDDIVKNMVVISGPTENSEKTDGWGSKLLTDKLGNVDYVWGIRTDTGTSKLTKDGRSIYSWMDMTANQTTLQSYNPFYTTLDDPDNPAYQIATSEDAVYEALINIYEKGKYARNDDITGNVQDVTVSDTITNEFNVQSVSAVITYYDKSGNVTGTQTITEDDDTYGTITTTVNADGTTDVEVVADEVVGKAKVDVTINLQAKEQYLGSNNVLTNVGTPDIDYSHGTGEKEKDYHQDYTDTPVVNVPIRLSVVDGLETTVHPGESVDLSTLAYTDDTKAETITGAAETKAELFEQTNGTLKYEWKDKEGTVLATAEVEVVNGVIQTGSRIPTFTVTADAADSGSYNDYDLVLTFTPNELTSDNPFNPVEPGTDSGFVRVNVINEIVIHKLGMMKGVTESLPGVGFAVYTASQDTVSGLWVQAGATALQSGDTDEGGLISFVNLPAGDYVIEETHTASGYMKEDDSWHLHIDSDGAASLYNNSVTDTSEISKADGKDYYEITNYALYELPSAGGIGVYAFCLLGSLLFTLAICSLKRKSGARQF